MPLVAAYTASKAAIEGFTEFFALELEPFGVRMKLVDSDVLTATTASASEVSARDSEERVIQVDYEATRDALKNWRASESDNTDRTYS